MAEVGLPLARAVVAHRRGDYGEVVDQLMPARANSRIGASHAQRDIFEQLLIDAAWRAKQLAVARDLLAERTALRPGNIWGWKHYARVLNALGAAEATTATRALDQLRADMSDGASEATSRSLSIHCSRTPAVIQRIARAR